MTPHDPIRHAYGEAEGPPPKPGEPGYAEYQLLRATREALDALPRRRPDAAVLDAVRAAAKAHALGPVRAAYGEGEPLGADDPRQVEFALLKGTKDVLDQLPKARPEASALDAVREELQGGGPLLLLRQAYDVAEGAPPAPGEPGHAEFALLKDTRDVLDALPRVRPDAETLAAVKAAALDRALGPVRAAYDEAEPPSATDPRHAEYALLRSTREVLSRTPKERPDAAVLAAITTAAGAQASPTAPLRPASPRPAADRPAEARVRAFPRIPTWVGMAAVLVIVATAGIWVLNERPAEVLAPESAAEQEADVLAGRSGAPEASGEADAADPAGPLAPQEESLLADAAPPASSGRAGSGASTGAQRQPPPGANAAPQAQAPPAAPPPAVALVPALPEVEQELGGALEDRSGFAADEVAVPVGAWEAGEDVRLLSLRLQQMAETSEGLSWDVPPAPFGEADADGAARLEGLQTVGDGPARVEVRMRTTPSVRSDGQ